MKSRLARAAFLIALFTIVLAGCGWFGTDAEGSLVVSIADLPDGITKITVNVTGTDMDPVSAEFTGDPANSDPLIIPEGTGRNWTVVVDTDNATPVTQYTAGGTADIVGGEITEVTASLLISGTKLVVIDDRNNRIVQVDDIGGAGWTVLDTLSWDMVGITDLEIGPNGKIYAAAGAAGIFVLDSIADTTPTVLPGTGGLSPAQIGIDHVNELIYFWDSSSNYGLYSVPLAGGTPTDYSDVIFPYFQTAEVAVIKGVTANDSGRAAIVYARDADLRSLTLDPTGSGSVVDDESVYTVGLGGEFFVNGESADIVAKGNAYYVVLFLADNARVLKLDSALVVQDSYGSLYDGETSGSDTLYGPALFVGHRNPQIQFIDDNSYYSTGVDQLVEIQDILGTGRTDFGATGSGVGEFEFFEPTPSMAE